MALLQNVESLMAQVLSEKGSAIARIGAFFRALVS